ncbi:GNAT family N-acetyltransferase [Alteromonadaceae bacterium BrNp21-10]|nr:GNAT family N-acetyltransferase [Alteromonadaceae bacterium BrNp21-10]
MSLETSRLILRQWQPSDRQAFAQLNADPHVMLFFPSPLSAKASDDAMQRYSTAIEKQGWGFWAVERKQEGDFIGFVGMQHFADYLPCAPGIEIGWRLAKHAWRKGYATEAATATVRYAFDVLKLTELCSITSAFNMPSQAVMKKIGMKNTKHNFLHPAVPEDSSLREHVLYKMTNPQQA